MYVLNGKYEFEEKTIKKILDITPFFKIIRARQSYNGQQGFLIKGEIWTKIKN